MTIKAQAEREGMEASKIAVFNYIVTETGIDEIGYHGNEGVSIDGNNLTIEGCVGSHCTISNTKGQIIYAKTIASETVRLTLSRNEVYLIRIVAPDGTVTIDKVVI